MALSLVTLTEQRLANLSDAQIAAMRDALPEIDWCSPNMVRPTRAQFLRYVRDALGEGLGATGVVDGTTPDGGVLHVTRARIVRVTHWYVTEANTIEVVGLIVPFARDAGALRIEGYVHNARIRARMLEAGANMRDGLVGVDL